MKERATVKNISAESAVPLRGRPRSSKARTSVLRVARLLLNEGGLGAVTMEALAARTGVSKPTIYRTWPNAHAVAMAALMDAPAARASTEAVIQVTTGGLDAVRRQLQTIVDVFASRTGRSITHVLAAADPATELSKVFRNHFILARREEGRTFLLEAMKTGELRRDLDVDVALDLLYAPFFYRILVGHAPLTESFVATALDELLRGLGPKSRKRS